MIYILYLTGIKIVELLIKMGEEINTKRLRIVGLILLLFGMAFFGFGFTGDVVMNSYTLGDSCSSNADCSTGKICCIISGTPNMCQDADICNNMILSSDKEMPKEVDYFSYANIGIIFIVFAVIIELISYFSGKRAGKSKDKKSKIKRKK
ncbi:Uncharacterised protein [uncultured archaeon]|nr:Uncharacterised protein [uncultured archaeon]